MSGRGNRSARSVVRLLVAALALLVAIGGAMPAYARVFGGPRAHSCHCATRSGSHASNASNASNAGDGSEAERAHTESRAALCACPLCFPELNDVDTYGAPSVTGRCGTDDPGWRTLSAPAVPTSVFVIVAPPEPALLPGAPAISPSQWTMVPDLRPPRASRA